jgi:hypothetical protein
MAQSAAAHSTCQRMVEQGQSMTLRQAAQQALEALEQVMSHGQAVEQAKETLRAALAEPEQEPVAWRFQSAVGGWAYGSQPPLGNKYPVYPLYAAPPQRKPLTDKEIGRIAGDCLDAWSCARAIEAAHGIGDSK